MTNNERLVATFATSLNIEASHVVDGLEYNTIPQWDSVAHMVLVAALEKEFGVMLDMDDIIEMSSVKIAKEILAKHDVVF
ncbi:hypothetical protein MGA5115_00424 [Marinomonas gallaica]|uniref:Carrier domain-containing protein n=1 Tax=Marinomonas gallaica TaxID=1806667 RepID=A0A1C3JMJ8_9GAMM|nr:acyl carrier protein [Marinomonas gallaica]SBT16344.1 hypothetical protein MGA5115_00424 [Marinomonas gallaica]SBT21392.1 hypothetical protein MGA5116_01985 [Marinomonas gallaica]